MICHVQIICYNVCNFSDLVGTFNIVLHVMMKIVTFQRQSEKWKYAKIINNSRTN